eukprot:Rmarinus@m.20694
MGDTLPTLLSEIPNSSLHNTLSTWPLRLIFTPLRTRSPSPSLSRSHSRLDTHSPRSRTMRIRHIRTRKAGTLARLSHTASSRRDPRLPCTRSTTNFQLDHFTPSWESLRLHSNTPRSPRSIMHSLNNMESRPSLSTLVVCSPYRISSTHPPLMTLCGSTRIRLRLSRTGLLPPDLQCRSSPCPPKIIRSLSRLHTLSLTINHLTTLDRSSTSSPSTTRTIPTSHHTHRRRSRFLAMPRFPQLRASRKHNVKVNLRTKRKAPDIIPPKLLVAMWRSRPTRLTPDLRGIVRPLHLDPWGRLLPPLAY